MNDQETSKPAALFSKVLTLNGKNFIEITQMDVPRIMPGKFYISIDGIIYNSLTHRFSEGCVNNKGYVIVELTDVDGKRFSTMKHIVLEHVFQWFDGCDKLEVNHKNGIKTDNRIENLEMINHSENVRHAFNTGLNPARGENHKDATTTEKQAREIIRLIQSGTKLGYAEIGELVGVSEIVVVQIATGYGWTWLYDEMGYTPIKRNERFTDDIVHQMCQIFVQNIGVDFPTVAKIVANNLGFEYCDNFRHKLRFIYFRRNGYFTRITTQYKYLPEDFN